MPIFLAFAGVYLAVVAIGLSFFAGYLLGRYFTFDLIAYLKKEINS